tara:strand:- start:761 stop:1018 length:258 start_codon:yes stop_codon:yes gene_type:complete
MIAFWPSRKSPIGFSNKTITNKNLQNKVARTSGSNDIKSRKKNSKNLFSNDITDLEKKHEVLASFRDKNISHWANRDFNEYRKAA